MKTFIVLLKQDGGCDYTIGCGRNWDIFHAESQEKAIEKVLQDCGHRFEAGDEQGLDDITLYEIVADGVDMNPLARQYNHKKALEQQAAMKKADEARELAELDRLQKKYGIKLPKFK